MITIQKETVIYRNLSKILMLSTIRV